MKEPAGFWIRFAAYLIDAMLIGTVTGIISLAVIAYDSTSMEAFVKNVDIVENEDTKRDPAIKTSESTEAEDYQKKHTAIKAIVWMSLSFLYNVIFNISVLQGTLGKYALGIKICDASENKIGVIRSIVRSLASYLSIVSFGLGFMMTGWNKKKKSLHDFIAGTQLVVVTKSSSC